MSYIIKYPNNPTQTAKGIKTSMPTNVSKEKIKKIIKLTAYNIVSIKILQILIISKEISNILFRLH